MGPPSEMLSPHHCGHMWSLKHDLPHNQLAVKLLPNLLVWIHIMLQLQN
jgi:hypothetical protein